MSTLKKIGIGLLVFVLVLAIAIWWLMRGDTAQYSVEAVTGTDPTLAEADAQLLPTVAIAEPVGWQEGEVPEAADGLVVNRFAEGLDHPRVMHALPNGDVLVTLTAAPPGEVAGGWLTNFVAGLLFDKAGAGGESANTLMLLRDVDGDGTADRQIALRDDLSSPSGIAWSDGTLYIANHDAVVSFPYELGAGEIAGEARKLMDLPPAGNHWMRNIVLSEDATKLYVAVGSASNIGEGGMAIEEGRAAIHELDLETGRSRLFGAGLRNPNGLAWNPWSGELWTTVNERDMLGSDLVPDYLTNVPVGVHYGWPWFYWNDIRDERVDHPLPNRFLAEYTRTPEYAMGPHVAALGLSFTRGGARMGERFGQGAFIARHGSWNRKPPAGYDVVYVAFDARGNPQGKPLPVLTGFLTGDGTTRGRPTWTEWDRTGALLVTDDTAGIVWRVTAPDAEPAAAPVRNTGRSLPPRRQLIGDPSRAFEEGAIAPGSL
ncbi:PQQ-dependent sugar dehydrogenase [Paraurantiacibacter namhicola]|uniref:Membrane bound L-sorbosone dehydrogenase n=1 Tax=Paraurantiacibacter namhicola TaxID=645517 RepID=A0A1C7D5K0_9SPHN|nr:sorbosone dehydrogenase family protein [Paraurantiacibacter namhicola]ANU06737.1 Membrane bound L-sorbosone dehydrogenase [Paraurantiacibacter namhicola]